MENNDEPLNLTIKKRPVAVVAPSAVILDANQNVKVSNIRRVSGKSNLQAESPEDLSVRKDLNDYISNGNDALRQYLFKNVSGDDKNFEKNNFLKESELKANIFRDFYKMNEFYDKNLATDNIYSMINQLAERKFLAAWYMNSVLGMPYSETKNATNSPTKNSILNNLLDQKPIADFKNSVNFDTLIRNEMNLEGYNKIVQEKNARYTIKHIIPTLY